jgi:hypothetical protein
MNNKCFAWKSTNAPFVNGHATMTQFFLFLAMFFVILAFTILLALKDGAL